MKPRIYVIAGNMHQFDDYVKRKRNGGDLETDYRYVNNENVFRGTTGPKGVFIGTWRDRPDIIAILSTLVCITGVDNRKIQKLLDELWETANHIQMENGAISNASKNLAKQIDAEVLKNLMKTNVTSWSAYNIPDEYDILSYKTWRT